MPRKCKSKIIATIKARKMNEGKKAKKEKEFQKEIVKATTTTASGISMQKKAMAEAAAVVEVLKIEHPEEATPDGATETLVFVESNVKKEPDEQQIEPSFVLLEEGFVYQDPLTTNQSPFI